MGLLSGKVREWVCRLYCATLDVLVVDDDRRPCVEVLLHLENFTFPRIKW